MPTNDESNIEGRINPFSRIGFFQIFGLNDWAADFIYQTLDKYGLTVYNQNFSTTGRNVFAIQTGSVYQVAFSNYL